MSIDERLMSAPSASAQTEEEPVDESADRVGQLRMQRRSFAASDGQASDWNSQRGLSRRQQLTSSVAGKVTAAKKSLSTATSKFLVWAWQNIFFTFGGSFFYTYIHLFLKNIFGDQLFAPLGSEWFDKPGTTTEARDKAGKRLKTAETFGVIAITLSIFLVILGALTMLAVIVSIVRSPQAWLSFIYQGTIDFLFN